MLRNDVSELEAAEEQGRLCALAMACQRELRDHAGRYPGLFPDGVSAGPSVFVALSLVSAFASPEATGEHLRFMTRVKLWIYAADTLVEGAEARAELDDFVAACLEVASGADPAPYAPPVRYLGEIRRDLTKATSFKVMGPVWQEHLARFLGALVREWEWRASPASGAALPGLDEYMDNADSVSVSFLNLSRWIYLDDEETLLHFPALSEATTHLQRALRLMNDLASHERELASGDLNVLALGVSRGELIAMVDNHVSRCRESIASLPAPCSRAAAYLERLVGFNLGFYRLADYWCVA